jgi:hypothetical protein
VFVVPLRPAFRPDNLLADNAPQSRAVASLSLLRYSLLFILCSIAHPTITPPLAKVHSLLRTFSRPLPAATLVLDHRPITTFLPGMSDARSVPIQAEVALVAIARDPISRAHVVRPTAVLTNVILNPGIQQKAAASSSSSSSFVVSIESPPPSFAE